MLEIPYSRICFYLHIWYICGPVSAIIFHTRKKNYSLFHYMYLTVISLFSYYLIDL